MHNYIEKAILLDEFSYIFNTGEMMFESEELSDLNFQQLNNEHDITPEKCLIRTSSYINDSCTSYKNLQ